VGRLAVVNLESGDAIGAERRFREALRIYTAALGAEHSWTGEARALMGSAMASQGRYPDAEVELLAGLAVIDASRESGAPATRRRVLGRMIDFYEAWERPADAERYRALLD